MPLNLNATRSGEAALILKCDYGPVLLITDDGPISIDRAALIEEIERRPDDVYWGLSKDGDYTLVERYQ